VSEQTKSLEKYLEPARFSPWRQCAQCQKLFANSPYKPDSFWQSRKALRVCIRCAEARKKKQIYAADAPISFHRTRICLVLKV
jgi:hypothetical protein